jgi:hypothetical protein
MKKIRCLNSVVSISALVSLACGNGSRDEVSQSVAALSQQSIAVPSYFRDWTAMLDKAPPVRLAVINPNSGPGTGYSSQVTAAQAKGVRVIGYVDTNYGSRDANTVRAEIDSYYSLYPTINGIFFDRAWNRCDRQPYYQSLYSYIKTNKSQAATVALNHGTAAESCYLNAGDILITFESDYGAYVNNFASSLRTWETSANAGRIWHIVYAANDAQLTDALNKSRDRQAGYVYVTNLGLPNPYGALPSYFAAEADSVTNFSGSQAAVFSRLRASNDAVNAYYSVFFSSPDTYHRVYIDTDETTATGFGHCGLGANYLVEDGNGTSRLYAYTGNGTSWSWQALGSVSVSLGGTSISWSVPRSSIGETAYPNGADVCFEAETTGNPIRTSQKIDHVYSNESGAIHAYFAENDGGTVFYQATFDVSYAQKHVFIDTDQNGATGYPVGGIGADYMIENGSLYRYAGAPPAWSWSSIGSSNMNPATSGATGATTWNVARSAIGETATSGEASRLVFHGRTSAGVEFVTNPVYLHVFSN